MNCVAKFARVPYNLYIQVWCLELVKVKIVVETSSCSQQKGNQDKALVARWCLGRGEPSKLVT